MDTSRLDYQSYLLRLWYAGGAWRASLQSTENEQVLHFADITALMAFLTEQTGAARKLPPPPTEPERRLEREGRNED